MTTEDTLCEPSYGFSCKHPASNATETLLSASETTLKTTRPDTFTLEAFIQAFKKEKLQLSEKTDQRKVKVTGNVTKGDDYVFAHFDDREKYIQRYRYYHTVDDAGQSTMDAHKLGIIVGGYSSDGTSTSRRSVTPTDLCSDKLRDLHLGTRRSMSAVSTSSTKRNKSAPCSRKPKSSKRVFLTWSQYMSIFGDDITSSDESNVPTGSNKTIDEGAQTTNETITGREVSSAHTFGKPCVDWQSFAHMKEDSSNLKNKHENESECTISQLNIGGSSLLTSAKSESSLGGNQTKLPRTTSGKREINKRQVVNKVTSSSNALSDEKDLRKVKSSVPLFTEGGASSLNDRPKLTSLPESDLEHGAVSSKSCDKRTIQREPMKKRVGYRRPNARVSAVYKFAKFRRKPIHL